MAEILAYLLSNLRFFKVGKDDESLKLILDEVRSRLAGKRPTKRFMSDHSNGVTAAQIYKSLTVSSLGKTDGNRLFVTEGAIIQILDLKDKAEVKVFGDLDAVELGALKDSVTKLIPMIHEDMSDRDKHALKYIENSDSARWRWVEFSDSSNIGEVFDHIRGTIDSTQIGNLFADGRHVLVIDYENKTWYSFEYLHLMDKVHLTFHFPIETTLEKIDEITREVTFALKWKSSFYDYKSLLDFSPEQLAWLIDNEVEFPANSMSLDVSAAGRSYGDNPCERFVHVKEKNYVLETTQNDDGVVTTQTFWGDDPHAVLSAYRECRDNFKIHVSLMAVREKAAEMSQSKLSMFPIAFAGNETPPDTGTEVTAISVNKKSFLDAQSNLFKSLFDPKTGKMKSIKEIFEIISR